jgi:hypothetical protein
MIFPKGRDFLKIMKSHFTKLHGTDYNIPFDFAQGPPSTLLSFHVLRWLSEADAIFQYHCAR